MRPIDELVKWSGAIAQSNAGAKSLIAEGATSGDPKARTLVLG